MSGYALNIHIITSKTFASKAQMTFMNKQMDALGLDKKVRFVTGDLGIPIHLSGEGSFNWNKYVPASLDFPLEITMPDYLPSRFLREINENNMVSVFFLSPNGTRILDITGAQLKSKFTEYGNFQKTLEYMRRLNSSPTKPNLTIPFNQSKSRSW